MIGNPREAYITNSGEIWYYRNGHYYSEARGMKIEPRIMQRFLRVFGGNGMEHASKVSQNFLQIASHQEKDMCTKRNKNEAWAKKIVDDVRNKIF